MNTTPAEKPSDSVPFLKWLKGVVRGYYKTDSSLRDALEEYIQATPEEGTADLSLHERLMLANVLKMRDLTVAEVMIPRAEIVAVEASTTRDDFLRLLAERQFSRFPVYRETLDDVIGKVHIKDIIAHMAQGDNFTIPELIRPVPVVSPSLPVSDLIMKMRENRKHMVMVIDEYGGIDGLVTITDVIETIFGQLSDEYSTGDDAMINPRPDGSVIMDTRLPIAEFETYVGRVLTDGEREHNDTLGGLIYYIIGRVPTRGEVIKHPLSGLKFDVIDGDARRIYRVRVKDIPAKK